MSQTRTFLMSFPARTWRIRGGTNFRSTSRQTTNPRRAAMEWLALADAITEAGGRVVVMPPADVEPPLTGMMYTANAGALFGGDRFLVSRMMAPHRLPEADSIERLVARLGLAQVSRARGIWEGQAEIATLPDQQYILTWGVRSDRASVDEVQALLPPDAKTLVVKLRDPFFHGDTCLAALDTPKGPALLACEEALDGTTLHDLRQFARGVNVIPCTREDALAYAANAMSVGGRWLAPRGISASLSETMAATGLKVVELELDELFGKGGGGPRCMINVLWDLREVPDDLLFRTQRPELAGRFAAYPEAAPLG